MMDFAFSSGCKKWNCKSTLFTQKTMASTIKVHLATPNAPPRTLFIHPRWMALRSLEMSLATILSANVIPKKSKAYATASQTVSGHVNCVRIHAEKVCPHNLAPMKPKTTAKMAMISVTNPFMRPLTRPMSKGSNMTMSSQVKLLIIGCDYCCLPLFFRLRNAFFPLRRNPHRISTFHLRLRQDIFQTEG